MEKYIAIETYPASGRPTGRYYGTNVEPCDANELDPMGNTEIRPILDGETLQDAYDRLVVVDEGGWTRWAEI